MEGGDPRKAANMADESVELMDLCEGRGKAALSHPLEYQLGPVKVVPHYLDQRPDSGQCCSLGVLEVNHEVVAVKVAVVAALVHRVLYNVKHLVIAGPGPVKEQGEETRDFIYLVLKF